MSPNQVADVLGSVASAGMAAVVALVVLRIAMPSRFRVVQHSMVGSGTILAAAIAVCASVASLWFSKGAHFPPCELCWYQRIAMYPLAVILPISIWRADGSGRRYGIALASIGFVISAWHNLIETVPSLDTGGCDPANPCTIRWVEGLGFWTIPRMAFVAFSLVLTTIALDHPAPEDQ